MTRFALSLTLAGLLTGCVGGLFSQPAPSQCPPDVPHLPGVREDGTVLLKESDQEALIDYFQQVHQCNCSQPII